MNEDHFRSGAKIGKYEPQPEIVRPPNTWWVAGVLTYLIWGGFLPEGRSQPTPQKPEITAMRIHFKRSGGFAGMPLTATIDVDVLSPTESQHLRQLIEAAEFFTLPTVMTASVPGGDRFQYTLTIETPERQHTVEIHEGAAAPALRPLLEWLTTAARGQRGSG
jgi:hypothetical protein